MQLINEINLLRTAVSEWRAQNQKIAFVPTMGNLHDGHLQLVEEAKQRGQKTVASIFVNPLQFPPGTDYQAYPRTLDSDVDKLHKLGIDILFAPSVGDLYPEDLGQASKVVVPGLSGILCGKFRPGHFEGVTTIVAKLFNVVQPDIAVFGEKDFQQLTIIKKMVQDLCFPVEIIASPTVREPDGLAMSSRNQYLTEQERKIAPELYKTLLDVKGQVLERNEKYSVIESQAMQRLEQTGFKPDYVSIRNSENLSPATKNTTVIVVAAAWLGSARLIDNVLVC